MKLHINGTMIDVPETIETITQLIDHLELSSPVIIVEHNEVVLQKDEHEEVKLSSGDKIEFVQFVGGG